MTIVLATIISIPLGLLISSHLEGVVMAEEKMSATNLARLDMERVKMMAYANIVSATFSNYLGHDYDVVRTVSYALGNSTSAESVKLVRVSVRRAGSNQDIMTLSTYITKNVNNGS